MADARDTDRAVKGRLRLAVVLTAVIFIAELAGGYLTNSLALISDAMHVLMDVVALSLSLFAIYISALPPTETRTYGLHRVEVFVSFINGASLVVISLFIFYKSYMRFLDPPEVESTGMLVVAVVGLVVNVVVALWLHGFARTDLNVKSAFLHVIGDAAASVGVIAAAVVMSFTGFNAIDPLISAGIGLIILWGSTRVVLEASHILLEGVPRGIELNEVVEDIRSVEGVIGVHSLNIWSICHNIHALSAHVEIDGRYVDRQGVILRDINERLAERYHIFYTTLQVECARCEEGAGVLRSMVHNNEHRFP